MISSHGLVYKQARTIEMLKSMKDERPVSFQLFGAEPDIMQEAACIMESLGPDMIDINMGCPVRKVTKKGAGAALMTTPKRAESIITKITKSVSLPVTVKFRSGRNAEELNGVEFAKMAEASGAAALIIHGRTWAQGFSGVADQSMIRAVKNAVTIPVIGNGDVTGPSAARQMMETTGCNGVMIGRAALGAPWVFRELESVPTPHEVVATACRHLELMEKHLDSIGLRLGYVKSHLCRYFKGWPGCSSARKNIFEMASIQDLKHLLEQFKESTNLLYSLDS